MSISRTSGSKTLALFLAVAFVVMTLPGRTFAQGGPKGTGGLVGHIYAQDMKTPVRNAVVKLLNVASQKEYESEPTDLEGMYRITGIDEGRYIMGVQALDGSYNFHYSLFIKADSLGKLSVAMKPGAAPASGGQGEGQGNGKGTGSFFKSPAGILSLVVVAEMALVVFVLAENETSEIRR